MHISKTRRRLQRKKARKRAEIAERNRNELQSAITQEIESTPSDSTAMHFAEPASLPRLQHRRPQLKRPTAETVQAVSAVAAATMGKSTGVYYGTREFYGSAGVLKPEPVSVAYKNRLGTTANTFSALPTADEIAAAKAAKAACRNPLVPVRRRHKPVFRSLTQDMGRYFPVADDPSDAGKWKAPVRRVEGRGEADSAMIRENEFRGG